MTSASLTPLTLRHLRAPWISTAAVAGVSVVGALGQGPGRLASILPDWAKASVC